MGREAEAEGGRPPPTALVTWLAANCAPYLTCLWFAGGGVVCPGGVGHGGFGLVATQRGTSLDLDEGLCWAKVENPPNSGRRGTPANRDLGSER